ncbi:deoxyribonuclease IV [Bacillota bacterium LX-D]|nr:deoxyribonuclease IV [Bacillota bacterium LX-D]
MYIGAHISISKGFSFAIEQANKIGGNTMQFFSRNPRGAGAKALNLKDIALAQEKAEKYGFGSLVAHAPYIINLASSKEDLWELAIRIMSEDLSRMDQAGVAYLVVHPGSHVGQGIPFALKRVSQALNRILQSEGQSIVLLETMSGSGTEVGKSLDELAQMIKLVENKERVGVCLDTCHLYSGGYDLRQNLDQFILDLEEKIGLDKVKAVHLNDSINPLGSAKDRHANIGEGLIGKDALGKFVTHPKLNHLPFLLETPGGLEIYQQEIAYFKSLE